MKATLEFDLPDEQGEYQDVLDAQKNAAIVHEWNEIMVKLYNKGFEYFGLDGSTTDEVVEWICKKWFDTRDMD